MPATAFNSVCTRMYSQRARYTTATAVPPQSRRFPFMLLKSLAEEGVLLPQNVQTENLVSITAFAMNTFALRMITYMVSPSVYTVRLLHAGPALGRRAVTNFLTTVSGWQRYFAPCFTHCPSSSWVCLLYVGLVSMCGNIFYILYCCGVTSLCLYRCASVAGCLIFEHETERYKHFFTRAHTYTRTPEGCGRHQQRKGLHAATSKRECPVSVLCVLQSPLSLLLLCANSPSS